MRKDDTQKAVIYCRVSSARQVEEGHGLESQEGRCREFASHKRYDVVRVFRDEGISGGLIDRPGMQAMLCFLRKNRKQGPHIVLIEDISRLARDVKAHIDLRSAITSAGARLQSPSIEFGEDSDSIMVENILATVSQHQREKNVEQVVNRMRARVLNGYWCFSPPFGYRYEEIDGHGKILVPDEPNASIVREVLESFATGRFETTTEVQRYLQLNPSVVRKGKGGVPFKFVRELLERPLYAGYMDVPKWKIRLQPAKHEPLVSFETWQYVQERLNGKPRAPIRKDISKDFPLRGFVLCASCDKPMTACWSKGHSAKYPYYFCNQHGCTERRKSIRKEHLEQEFEALLVSLRPTRGLYDIAERMFRDVWERRMEYGQVQAKSAPRGNRRDRAQERSAHGAAGRDGQARADYGLRKPDHEAGREKGRPQRTHSQVRATRQKFRRNLSNGLRVPGKPLQSLGFRTHRGQENRPSTDFRRPAALLPERGLSNCRSVLSFQSLSATQPHQGGYGGAEGSRTPDL